MHPIAAHAAAPERFAYAVIAPPGPDPIQHLRLGYGLAAEPDVGGWSSVWPLRGQAVQWQAMAPCRREQNLRGRPGGWR
jgi:hypothetical protein